MFDKSTLVVFGDSNVWGAEMKDVPERQYEFKSIVYDPSDVDNWPYHIRYSFSGVIAEQKNMKILNLAIPGCSNDTIFRRINKFVQGNYPVDLDDCFVMVFWTGIARREFYRNDGTKYLNYAPSWERRLQVLPKLHKLYSQQLWHDGYDLNRSINYVFSISALLTHYKIAHTQGYALQDERLAYNIRTMKVPYFLSYDANDAISASVIIKGDGRKNNPYIFKGFHPTELGHKFLAEKYTKLIDENPNSCYN